MGIVNYGTPVVVVDTTGEYDGVTWSGVRAQHEGETGHEQMAHDEQCECGILNLGLVRREPTPLTPMTARNWWCLTVFIAVFWVGEAIIAFTHGLWPIGLLCLAFLVRHGWYLRSERLWRLMVES